MHIYPQHDSINISRIKIYLESLPFINFYHHARGDMADDRTRLRRKKAHQLKFCTQNEQYVLALIGLYVRRRLSSRKDTWSASLFSLLFKD